MPSPGMLVYFAFILLIIIAIFFKKKPVIIAALGLLAVGVLDTGSFFVGIQVAFRGFLLTAADLLPIILLIGLVVAMTGMLKETKTETILIKSILKIKNVAYLYWLAGAMLLSLSLFLWPTPAVSLLGALILPLIHRSRIPPLGLAVGLCIFGEGIALAGDYVIQGAPGLTARSAGVALEQVLRQSLPLVCGSGIIASLIGFQVMTVQQKKSIPAYVVADNRERLDGQKGEEQQNEQEQEEQEKQEELDVLPPIKQNHQSQKRKRTILALTAAAVYLLAVIWLVYGKLRGDSAVAVIGGVTLLVLIIGTVLTDYKTSFNTFGRHIQTGMKFSMEVFAPIVVISGFFLLGTHSGYENVLLHQGAGYLEQLADKLSGIVVLNKYSCALLVMLTAVLGAMSGSGFAALPLAGGIAAALGQAAGISAIPLAVLGQVTAIWTDAAVIPWGFPAIVSAVTQTEAAQIVRLNMLPWLAALCFSLIWTLFSY
ncbi:hypothetical protein [Dehalobacter sp. 4CP]|uniref:hypothetical protein n=1 Tax=Dehalobacter sp. CP TaxID=2594474 RepID=UPI0039E935F3